MKFITIIVLLLSGVRGIAQTEQRDGWQFYAFFGTYNTQGATCSHLNGQVKVGFTAYSNEQAVFEVKPLFSTEQSKLIYLRNSESHGQDCYECDPGWWESEKIEGDGILNAIYKQKGITPYYYTPYSTVLELIKTAENKIFVRLNDCSAELIKLP